jgi:hypothetical protein
MKRMISLSALVSGLLASQGFAAPASPVVRRADDASMIAPEQPMSTEAAARLQAALVEMVEKGPEDVGGMRALHRAMAMEMQAHLGQVLAAGPDVGSGVTIEFDDKSNVGLIGQRLEKGTFLGVTTSRVAGALREQLGLPKGMGLVVDFVAKDSPAEAAGLKVHDVLTKLDDQWLVNMEQLAVLVRSKKPGDEVTLTAIRGGKETKIAAKLAEKDIPMDVAPEPWRGGMIVPGGGGNRIAVVPAPGDWQVGVAPAPGDWQVRGHVNVNAPGDGSTVGVFRDDDHEIRVTRDKDGQSAVVVKDKSGTEIYNGPYNTAEEKGKLPENVRAKVERVEKHQGARVITGEALANADSVMFKRVDSEHEIEVRITKTGRSMTAKDVKTGQLIYRGTGEGEEELAKMPAGLAEKVRSMKAKVEIRK